MVNYRVDGRAHRLLAACKLPCRGMVLAAVLALAVPQAQAQDHGIGVLISCDSTNCVGDFLSCSGPAINLDDFNDTWEISQAWWEAGVMDVRVPAAGNAPISQVVGNALCTDDGGACNPADGANCALPCLVGPANCTANGLPGAPAPGQVRFTTAMLHTIQQSDLNGMNQVPTQLFVEVSDLCNGEDGGVCQETAECCDGVSDPGCDTDPIITPSIINNPPATPSCDDGDACTEDMCISGTGQCENTPIVCDDGSECTTDTCDPAIGCVHTAIDCDDDDECTADTCDPATGCVNTPIICDDGSECTTDTCDPATGCVHTAIDCDDDDACTADSCDPATGCVNTPIVCNDMDACTSDSCDPASGCVFTPINCDDMDACTADSCDPATGCVHEDISDECDDDNACTIDTCDPEKGCQHEPVDCDDGDNCTVDICDPAVGCIHTPIVCDDKDFCTDDVCDPATGLCVFTDIEPPPPGCAGGEGCTPGYWKLIDEDPANASHQCNYEEPHEPHDLFKDTCADCNGMMVCFEDAYPGKTLIEVLETGGGGPRALGRHTVAAFLNAASPDVAYLYSACEVVTMFNDAWPCSGNECNGLKSLFSEQNETCCPLSNCKCSDSNENCTEDDECGMDAECGGRNDDACTGDDDDDLDALTPAAGGDEGSVSEDEDSLQRPQSTEGAESATTGGEEDHDVFDGSLAGSSATCGAFGLVSMLLLLVGLLGVRWNRSGFEQ